MLFAVTELPKSVDIQRRLTSIHIQEWLKHDVFHWRWWVLLCLIFILFLVWWILVDKARAHEVFLYTVLAIIVVLCIVEYGDELTLWDYPVHIIPIFPPLTTMNLLILPLVYSLIYQHYNAMKNFVTATLIITAVICFGIEPALSFGGFYHLLHWKYYYSFILYSIIAILIRTLVLKINSITAANRYKIKN